MKLLFSHQAYKDFHFSLKYLSFALVFICVCLNQIIIIKIVKYAVALAKKLCFVFFVLHESLRPRLNTDETGFYFSFLTYTLSA